MIFISKIFSVFIYDECYACCLILHIRLITHLSVNTKHKPNSSLQRQNSTANYILKTQTFRLMTRLFMGVRVHHSASLRLKLINNSAPKRGVLQISDR